MSWFVVGGIAIGATAGAIVGSKKGGDDVWKDALIGGAIGGTAGVGGGYAAGAFGAEAAAPAVVAGEGGAGILGAGGAMAPAAAESLAFTGPSVGSVVAPEAAGGFGASSGMGLGQAGGFGTPGAFAGSSSPFGSFGGATAPEGGGLLNAGFTPGMQAPIQMVQTPAATEYAMWGGDEATNVAANTPKTPTPPPEDSALNKGFKSAMGWLSEPKNAMLTGVLGLGALSMFNRNNENEFNQPDVQTAGYPLSPNFKPSRYQPTRTYADGGIASIGPQTGMFPQSQYDKTQFAVPSQMPISREVIGSDYDTMVNPYTGEPSRFAEGGDTDSKRERYYKNSQQYAAMIDPRTKADLPDTPDWVRSRGVYHDEDPDTKYEDALTAAQTRMGKAAGRANVQLYAMQKPTPMGKLNLGPVAGQEERKATGGITSLGGYAHGGNPRLLRGPGDGMSDDIPATIAEKQPARLADGEFVVPADVVSGLGNGSTEAGAKKLHQMMDKVRVDRTGTKKQGKQINADKYVPGAKAEKKASGGIASYASGNLVVNPDTNEVGYWTGQNEWGIGGTWNPVTQEQYNQTTTPAPTANTTSQGYNPDYYNPQYYQSQLDAFSGQKTFDPTYYLNQYTDVAADPYYSKNPFEHYQKLGLSEGRSPYEGGQAGAQLLDTTAQQKLQDVQSNIARLEATPIKYDPYTIANRPSAAEPQFYGNIYRGATPDYSTPGYTLGGNLGRWNNIAGEAARAAQPASMNQQVTQAYLQNLGRAPDTAGFNYWMKPEHGAAAAVKEIAASPEAQNIKPEEKKKRKGGILAAKK